MTDVWPATGEQALETVPRQAVVSICLGTRRCDMATTATQVVLYVLASVGFLRSFGSPHHVGIGSSKRGNPEDRTRVHSQGEDRRPGVGREQRDDHHTATGWFF